MTGEMVRTFMWLIVGAAMVGLLIFYWVTNRQGRLDCGCLRWRTAVYGCMTCGHTRCAEHRYVIHTCTDGR